MLPFSARLYSDWLHVMNPVGKKGLKFFCSFGRGSESKNSGRHMRVTWMTYIVFWEKCYMEMGVGKRNQLFFILLIHSFIFVSYILTSFDIVSTWRSCWMKGKYFFKYYNFLLSSHLRLFVVGCCYYYDDGCCCWYLIHCGCTLDELILKDMREKNNIVCKYLVRSLLPLDPFWVYKQFFIISFSAFTQSMR